MVLGQVLDALWGAGLIVVAVVVVVWAWLAVELIMRRPRR